MGVYTVNQTDGSLVRVAGGTLYADAPIGAIQSYGGETAPAGWLICDGSTVSRTEYAELFAVIGINFGKGDGETTFGIPDLRECVPVGAGKNITKSIANHDRYDLGQFKDDALGTHDHPLKTVTTATYNTAGVPVGVAVNNTPTSATHGKQLGVNYIIKAKMVTLPADFLAKVGEVYQEKNLNTPIVINKASRTTVESALSSLADIAVHYSISSPNATTKYYLLKNKKYQKVNNLLIMNRYATAVGIFTSRPTTASARAHAYRLTDSTYGINGIKLGQITENETTYGVMYLQIGAYNPITIIQLDNRTVSEYVLTEITQQEYEAATASTLTEFVEYTSLDEVPLFVNSEHLSYSTSATFTGKTWIDGKPIYRKVVDCGTLPNNTIKYVPHGISNLSKVVSLTGMASNASYSLVLPHVSNSNFAVEIEIEGANIDISVLSDMSGYTSSFVVIEYTRTTD